MFQRLKTAANGLFENTAEVFKYELSSVPSSMFDCNGLPREGFFKTETQHIFSFHHF
jgi:hypothetical protein